jgi:hypothetical protein
MSALGHKQTFRNAPESGHTVMRLKGLLSAKSGLVQRSKKDSYLMI